MRDPEHTTTDSILAARGELKPTYADLLATITQLCFVIRTGGDVLAACEGAEAVISRAMGEPSHG